MKLTWHLNNEELREIIFDSDRHQMQRTLDALPGWTRSATARPDAFWERQHSDIRRRIAGVPKRSHTQTVTALSGALAVLLLAIFLLSDSPGPRSSRAPSDPDQELLVAVEQSVQSGVPQALEPAAMLAEEISSGQPVSASHRVYKENENEEQ